MPLNVAASIRLLYVCPAVMRSHMLTDTDAQKRSEKVSARDMIWTFHGWWYGPYQAFHAWRKGKGGETTFIRSLHLWHRLADVRQIEDDSAQFLVKGGERFMSYSELIRAILLYGSLHPKTASKDTYFAPGMAGCPSAAKSFAGYIWCLTRYSATCICRQQTKLPLITSYVHGRSSLPSMF